MLDKYSENEKKQLLGISLISLVVTVACWQFLLAPSLRDQKELIKEVMELEEQVAKDNEILARKQSVHSEFNEIGVELQNIINYRLPPDGNPLAWITNIIEPIASSSGIDSNRINFSGGVQGLPVRTPGKDGTVELLSEYSLDMSMTGCSYHDLGTFLAKIEELLPNVRVRNLRMGPAGTDENPILSVQMVLIFTKYSLEGMPMDSRPSAPKPAVPIKEKEEKS